MTKYCIGYGESSTSTFVPPAIAMLALDCPNLDGQSQLVTMKSQKFTFKIQCFMDYTDAVTFMAVTTYTFQDCISAYASYNTYTRSRGCQAVKLGTNRTFLEPDHYGTCYLKNGTGILFTATTMLTPTPAPC
ncbi:hypothetical protein GQ53DRAFT_770529 [Thozetella sp. PMI_491]|nr:hypothetical protein GQ53DRAFT_770529 [Thozetella sp. PMI_491]